MKSAYSWMGKAGRMTLGMALVLSALAASAQAGPPGVPEIDPGSMGSALTLVIGGAMMLTGRARKS
jgi:hypothetical protein